ncbi:MAG: hypothetical protein H5T76_33250 [Streptomyces sp.]|nr:hypothetical protein [Streptomyces sp.]
MLLNPSGAALVGRLVVSDGSRRMTDVNFLGTITATEVFLDQLKAAEHGNDWFSANRKKDSPARRR